MMVVERREEADDHIVAIYGVYIHRREHNGHSCIA